MDNPFSLLHLIQSRRSTRRFQPLAVPRAFLLRCVEAARLAPSAENAQTWRFYVVDDPQLKDSLADQAFRGLYRATQWAAAAPVLVALCAKPDLLANRLGRSVTGTPFFYIDAGIAGEHFCLQAEELGLGTCWIGWFSKKGVRRALGLSRDLQPVALFAVGFPTDSQRRPLKRKTLQQICVFNQNEKPGEFPSG